MDNVHTTHLTDR